MRRLVIALAVSSLLCTAGIFAPARAQEAASSIAVTQTTLDDHIVFEVTGSGFPAGQEVHIRASNLRTKEGFFFVTVATSESKFGGVFLGRTADGTFFTVSPGPWKVRAVSGDVRARVALTVP